MRRYAFSIRHMKDRLKVFIETHTPLVCFSVFVFFSFVALLLFQSRALNEMRERNERILSHYSQILSVSSEQNQVIVRSLICSVKN